MLVQELCDYADKQMQLPPPNYLKQPVRYIIDLDTEGRMPGGPIDTADPEARSTRYGVPRIAPHLKKANGTRPRILSDSREYVFGVSVPGGQDRRARERHQAFLELLEDCALETNEPAVAAVATLLTSDSLAEPPHWAQDLDPSSLITFRVGGEFPIDLPSVQHYWAKRQIDQAERGSSIVMLPCIACGEIRPALRRHPLKINGIPRQQPSGTDLISANEDAYESYGQKNSLIAPTCSSCAQKYGSALNALLADASTHLRVGQCVYAFWTREEVGYRPGTMLSDPDPVEVRELLAAVREGKKAATEIDQTRFYAVGLSANISRVVVRSWIDSTVGEARSRLAHYFALQHIEEANGAEGFALPIWRLANATVRDSRKEKPVPGVTDGLLELALAGRRLPEDVLFRAVQRCRAGQGVTRERAALIKIALGSEQGWTTERIEAMSGLDSMNHEPAYLCGRLLAVVDAIQRRAISANATVVDKFYGTASSAPASVFGNLLGNAQNHLAKLRKNPRSAGASTALDVRLMDVMDGLEKFPNTLTLPQQAMFALGFYHQRAADRRAAREWADENRPDDEHDETPDESASN